MSFETRNHKLHYPITAGGGKELSEITVKAPTWVTLEKSEQLARERETSPNTELARLCIKNGTQDLNDAQIDDIRVSDMMAVLQIVGEMCNPPVEGAQAGKSDGE